MDKYKNAYQLFLHLVDEDTALLKQNLDALVKKTDPLHNETLKLIKAHISQKKDTLITSIINHNAIHLLGDDEIEQMEGQQLSVYKLEKKLGIGGMSVVYLAKRIDGEMNQQVAIKVIKPSILQLVGNNLLNREAQILENIKHSNIATIYNIGRTSEGLPFIIMEFVNGLPIDEYCEINELSFLDRLKIFKTLCQAVQSVHANGIIHADIKPSNILVDRDGILKLMDFGIARGVHLDDRDVEIAAASMDYASPEQLLGHPLSTASDLFSLGKVANKIFSENHQENFQSKSQLKWLINQLTSKRQIERKITIESLIKVIDALLYKKKIENYPYSKRENIAFFIKNNPLKISLSLFTFVFFTTLLLVSYSKNKTIEYEKNIAEETAHFLESIFQFTDPSYGLTHDVSLEELLDKSTKELLTKRFSNSKSKQRIRIALANAYLGLGKIEKAKQQVELIKIGKLSQDYRSIVGRLHFAIGNYTKAIEMYENLILENNLKLSDHLDILVSLIYGLTNLNEIEKAESYIGELNKLIQKYNPKNGQELSLKASGFVNIKKGKYQESAEIYEELLKVAHLSDNSETSTVLFNLGSSYEELGNFEKAFTAYKQAIKLDEKYYGKKHPITASGYGSMGYLLDTMGQIDESISTFQKAIDITNDIYPNGHPELANLLNNQAYTYKQLGQYELAYQQQLLALEMIKKFLDENHPRIANIQNSIGVTLSQLNRYDESIQYYQLAYESRVKSLGVDHLDIHQSHVNLAQVEKSRQNFEAAHLQIDRAIKIVSNNLGSDSYQLLKPLSVKASIFREKGEFDQAIELEKHIIEVAKKSLGEEHWRISLYFNQLSLSYFKSLQYSLAIDAVEQAIHNLKKQKEFDEVLLADFYVNKGKYMFKKGKISQSLNWIKNGLKLYQSNQSNKVEKTQSLIKKITQT